MEDEPATSTVRQMEQILEEFNRRRKAGELAFDDFQRELDKLKVEDAEGNQWALDAHGRWYEWQDDGWMPASPPSDVRAQNLADVVTMAKAMGVILETIESIVPVQRKGEEEGKEVAAEEHEKVINIGRIVLFVLQIFFAFLMLAVGLLSVVREEGRTIAWAAVISLGFLVAVIGLVMALKRERRTKL